MGLDLLEEFGAAFSEGLISNTLTTCSRWASKTRIMGEPLPGPYSWKYHPWVKELHDTDAGFNYAMKAAQMGVTEVAINRAFYTIAQKKRDVLYVLPTQLNATDFSKARFNTALKQSPKLASIFTDTNTVSLKQAGNTTLYIRGSRGDSNLKSIPVSELILDEVDEMDQKQIWLALERLSGQLRKCVWGISTPTVPNWGIHQLYLTGTQEHFVFRCPSCSRWTELVWPDCMEIIGEHAADRRCQESYLKCRECKARLHHEAKPEFLAAAEWKSMADDPNPDIRSFYVNQLYSFTVTPGEIVVAYFRGFGDEFAAKEFHNSKLGQPFVGEGAQLTDAELKCIGDYTMEDARPQHSGRLITMGVDQGKWNYYEVTEWFVDDYTHDINAAAQAKVLAVGKFLENQWDYALDELMREWQVMACVIDADPQINEARRFGRRFPGYVWLCRYRRGVAAKDISLSDDGDGAPMATVDRTSWLSAALGRFRSKRIMLPRDVPHEYLSHLKSPIRTYDKIEEKDKKGKVISTNPVAVFKSTGPDHYAHARCYSEIALPMAASIVTNKDIASFL